MFGNRIQDGLPQGFLRLTAFTRFHNVAQCQEHTRLAHGGIDDGAQVAKEDQVAHGRTPNLLLGATRKMLGLLISNLAEQLLGLAPIALERHKHGDLVPDVLEAGFIVRDRLAQDATVGDVYDAPRALIRINPVPDFDDTELEKAQINHIAGDITNLNAVTGLERLAPQDKDPAGHIGNRVMHRHGQSGTGQAQEGGQRVKGTNPHAADQHQGHDGERIDNDPPPVMKAARVVYVAFHD